MDSTSEWQPLIRDGNCCKGVSEGSPVLRFPFVRLLLVFVTNDEDYV